MTFKGIEHDSLAYIECHMYRYPMDVKIKTGSPIVLVYLKSNRMQLVRGQLSLVVFHGMTFGRYCQKWKMNYFYLTTNNLKRVNAN